LDGVWKIIHHIGLLPILGMMIGDIKDFLKLKEVQMNVGYRRKLLQVFPL
jgi:hypothetical protein